jgi:hypothetical protein
LVEYKGYNSSYVYNIQNKGIDRSLNILTVFIKFIIHLRIKGFHLIVGKGIIAFSLLTDSKALGLVGNFSEILTDDCRYSWPLYIPESTRIMSIM